MPFNMSRWIGSVHASSDIKTQGSLFFPRKLGRWQKAVFFCSSVVGFSRRSLWLQKGALPRNRPQNEETLCAKIARAESSDFAMKLGNKGNFWLACPKSEGVAFFREGETTIKMKFALLRGVGTGGTGENRPKTLFFVGNATIKFWKCKFYCREILLSLRRLLIFTANSSVVSISWLLGSVIFFEGLRTRSSTMRDRNLQFKGSRSSRFGLSGEGELPGNFDGLTFMPKPSLGHKLRTLTSTLLPVHIKADLSEVWILGA